MVTTWWYETKLPEIFRGLAEEHHWITNVVEKHWIPIEKGRKLWFSFQCIDGETTFQVPTTNRQQETAKLVTVDPEHMFDGLELLLCRFFLKRGFVWLGLDASEKGTTRVGTLSIPKARRITHAGLDDVNISLEPIRALRLKFLRYVKVTGIETTDGYELSILLLGTCTVRNPYLAWYNLGGRAYESLDTRIAMTVRSAAEKQSLFDMYQAGDNAEDAIEEEISSGHPDMLNDIGIETNLQVEEWGDNSPDAFKIFVGRIQTAQQEASNMIAAQKAEISVKSHQRQVLAAEAELEISRAHLQEKKLIANKAEFEALLGLAGGDVNTAVQLVLKRELGDHVYERFMQAEALKKTNLQVLGSGATPLINLNNP